MQLSKEIEEQINNNVSFETKEKVLKEIRTDEDFRQWRLKRLQQVTGIELEDIEINGTKYIFVKNK